MKTSATIWKVAFIFLLIAGLTGLVLRFQFVSSSVNFNYQFLLHTHSHVILLGWVFNAIIAGLHIMFLRDEKSGIQTILYVLFQLSVLGMLISFPYQGYGFVSIFFSTLHIILSYVWVVRIWKKSAKHEPLVRSFIQWGLFYLVVSTIGPFSLGPIITNDGAGSDLYFMAIYFYLHFLYNGAFIFMLSGMFFWLLNQKGIQYGTDKAKQALKLMNIACLLTLMLSTLWMQPHFSIYLVGALGGVIQLVGIYLFIRSVGPHRTKLKKAISRGAQQLLAISFTSLIIKVILQLFSALPAIADFAYQVRNITIGYLHLVFLGVITPFLFAWFNSTGLMSLSGTLKKAGMTVFLSGFILTEAVIVIQPWWRKPEYYSVLFLGSLILWFGIALLLPVRVSKTANSN